MGKWTQRSLVALGATAFIDLGLGDDDDDLEGDFENWRAGLWEVNSNSQRSVRSYFDCS